MTTATREQTRQQALETWRAEVARYVHLGHPPRELPQTILEASHLLGIDPKVFLADVRAAQDRTALQTDLECLGYPELQQRSLDAAAKVKALEAGDVLAAARKERAKAEAERKRFEAQAGELARLERDNPRLYADPQQHLAAN